MAGSRNTIRDQNVRYRVHSDYQAQFNTAWFDPDYWGEQSIPVSSGGRGSAWFIESADVSGVLRCYLRGGLIARFSKASYLFMGERKVRSFAEFELLLHLHSLGLPVPRPVAACYQKKSVWLYSAAILVERLSGAYPLADLISSLSREQWRDLGRTLKRFHDAGVRHADLNCFNILQTEDGFYLIDFDKGAVEDANGVDAPWKRSNLARLYRSLTRLEWELADVTLEHGWSALRDGYKGASDAQS